MKGPIGLALTLGVLSTPAAASEFIDAVAEEIEVGPAGGWVRLFRDEASDGWHFLWAAGGDYIRLPMTAGLQVEDLGRTSLTGRTDLVDHAITACPGGGYLHVASANKESFNDSAYAFRYDSDFNLLASGTLEEAEPSRFHNDLPILCTPELDATAFIASNHGPTSLAIIGEDATQESLHTLSSEVPRTEGGSLRMDPDTGEIIVIGKSSMGQEFEVAGLDANFEVVWKKSFRPLSDGSLRPYWPQALMKINDYFLLAFMARDDNAGFSSDWGNAYLAVLSSDYDHLETVQVSFYDPPEGGQRPGIARKGDQLLLTMDRNVQPVVFPIRLNAEAFGIEASEDTGGWWDTSASGGSGEDGADSEGCACASTPRSGSWGAWGLSVALFGLVRRRSGARGVPADGAPGADSTL